VKPTKNVQTTDIAICKLRHVKILVTKTTVEQMLSATPPIMLRFANASLDILETLTHIAVSNLVSALKLSSQYYFLFQIKPTSSEQISLDLKWLFLALLMVFKSKFI
jgi:hypothetical protein